MPEAPQKTRKPKFQMTTCQNLPTIPPGREDTDDRKTASFLPLGGGKLRCRDVLGLGSGRGSCVSPKKVKQWVEDKSRGNGWKFQQSFQSARGAFTEFAFIDADP